MAQDIEEIAASIEALIDANNQHLINVWELSLLIQNKVDALGCDYSKVRIDELKLLTLQLSRDIATLIVLPSKFDS